MTDVIEPVSSTDVIAPAEDMEFVDTDVPIAGISRRSLWVLSPTTSGHITQLDILAVGGLHRSQRQQTFIQ